jgi:hypothetical protein
MYLIQRVLLVSLLIASVIRPLPAQDASSSGLDPFHCYEIRIRFLDDNWEKRLKAYRSTGREDKLMASVVIDGQATDSVGVRFKGNSSFNSVRKKGDRKLPFSLDANEFVKGGVFTSGHRNLKLSNGFRDPSYLRDLLSYYIARTYMPAPECAMARVYVNEEYFGVYTLTQGVDKPFLQQHFGERNGPFFKCDPEWKQQALAHCPPSDQCSLEEIGKDSLCYALWYEMKSDRGWQDLIALVKELNKPQPDLEAILDMDRTLWMLAFNNLLVNLDSYSGRLCHNYFLYRHRDSLFVPLIWDLNLSFGGFRMADKTNLTDKELIELSPMLHSLHPRRPLIRKLLEVPLYRKIYLAHMETMLDEYFRNGHYLELIRSWQDLLDKPVKEERMALYPYASFKENSRKSVSIGGSSVIGIQELMDARVAYLNQHPLLQRASPDIVSAEIQADSLMLQIRCQTSGADQVHLYWRYEEDLRFQRMALERMADVESAAGNWFWGGLPVSDRPIVYYLVAENDHKAKVYPRRASAEPLSWSAP